MTDEITKGLADVPERLTLRILLSHSPEVARIIYNRHPYIGMAELCQKSGCMRVATVLCRGKYNTCDECCKYVNPKPLDKE